LDASLFLGIDGGASKCHARLEDSTGRILGEGSSGPANFSLDQVQAQTSILEAAKVALHAAGLPWEDIKLCQAGIGMAGAGPAELRIKLMDGWHPFAKANFASDAHVAWLGAHGGSEGAVICLGTGSIGYGRHEEKTIVLGGWGADISDEASASAIGREALRRSIWAWDGRAKPTSLTENVLAMFGGNPASMALDARKATPAEYAAFAPLVFQFGAQKDAIATSILQDAALHVVRMIDLFSELGIARIALMGGTAEAMKRWLPNEKRNRLCTPYGDGVDGAILLAKRSMS